MTPLNPSVSVLGPLLLFGLSVLLVQRAPSAVAGPVVAAAAVDDLSTAAATPQHGYAQHDDGLNHDHDVGYLKKSDSKGGDGYEHFESFHDKDGDKYGYEKHEAFGGKGKKGAGGKKATSGKKANVKKAANYEVEEGGEETGGQYTHEDDHA